MGQACSHCGALHFIQERVKNTSKRNPVFGQCCNHGRVTLPALQDPPEPLLCLLTGVGERPRHFRQHFRSYNCAFQLASSTLKTTVGRCRTACVACACMGACTTATARWEPGQLYQRSVRMHGDCSVALQRLRQCQRTELSELGLRCDSSQPQVTQQRQGRDGQAGENL
jgi:hypothetical protein